MVSIQPLGKFLMSSGPLSNIKSVIRLSVAQAEFPLTLHIIAAQKAGHTGTLSAA